MEMPREILSNLHNSLTMMMIRVHATWSEIRADEEAMEVIQVVMLIAVGVLAIAAVWAGVNGLLEQWWTMITGASGGSGGPNLPSP